MTEALGKLVRNYDSRRVPLSGQVRASRVGPYPYYGATGVMDYVDDYLFEGLHLLVAEDGSVETPEGKPFLQLVDGQFWVNNHAHVLKGETDSDTRFLYYALSTIPIRPFMSGSVQAKLSQANLNQIPVPYPREESYRHTIADVLGTLDDKIELNRRMNETLEEIARALFRSWFVDFDPVRAKMEGRWRSGESLPGLPADLYDLFPDRLVPSELGDIPEGWEVKTLGECASLNPESWSDTNPPGSVEYVDLGNTKWGAIESTQDYAWESAPSRAKRILRVGDTIIGTVRPGNGSYSLIGADGLTGSTGFAVLRPNHPRYREFIYLAATRAENIDRMASRADGAAYPAVRPNVVGETEVIQPSAGTALLGCFSTFVAPMLNAIEANKLESHTLAAKRDALLPRLVSGEVRVGEVG